MSQGTPNWPPLQQSDVSLGYGAIDHSIQVWAQDLIAAPSDLQGQSASPQEPLPRYLTGSDEFSYEMVLLEDYLSSQELADIKSGDTTNHLSFDGNAHAQPNGGQGLLSVDIPPYYEPAGPPTCSTFTDSSSPSPVEPCVAGDFLDQGLPSIRLADTTDQIFLSVNGNEHSQPGDVYIPVNVDAFLPTSWDISSQSRVGPSEPWRTVIKIEEIEDLKYVGSPQIQEAAGKRRKKKGIHQCPYRHITGCPATFTARHNLRYHQNSHLRQKPYKCSTCSYAAASPATMKRHQSTCKGTGQPVIP